MFEILFGWRKASKCKKLIRRVQCRLKLLKNKRCAIVRQVREDVAQLLKYGHDQTAFNRVEQVFKDESIVAVYDLLDHFCEFIIIHLSYIRRHKDCPNDINEAVSSLIFASARFGDLPELPVIRKLFGERYGARFAKTALELLPGNLVNRQIKDNLSIKSVLDEVKYKLVDEIARSCLPMRPLAIEYSSELHQQLANKNNGDQETNIDVLANKSNDDQVRKIDVRASYNNYKESQLIAEGKIVHVDVSSKRNKFSTVPNVVESSIHDICVVQESASDTSSHMQEELIYLDDVEEFQSPHSKDGNNQDQRLFMFKSSVFPVRDRNEGGSYKGYTRQYESWNEKAGSRRLRNTRKAARKRSRNPSFYWENRSMKDVEREKLSNGNCKSHFHPRKHQKKLQMKDIQILGQPCYLDGKMVNSNSEHPCYPRVNDLKNPPWQPKQPFLIRDLKEESIQYGIYYCPCSCNGKLNNNLIYPEHLSTKNQKCDYRGSDSSYLRAMTMPPERPNDSATENILRSNSFPFREPSQFSNGTSYSPHVHPKMPDYDELAARFMALKKENLQRKHLQVGKPVALV